MNRLLVGLMGWGVGLGGLVGVAMEPVAAETPVVRFLEPAIVASAHGRDQIRPLPEAVPVVSGRLTLAKLEQLALMHNPVLAQARFQVQAAQGRWRQAGLPANPRLAYVGEEIGDSGTAGQQGGSVSQTFLTGGKRRLGQAAAAAAVTRAEQRFAAQRLRVQTDVRAGYYQMLVAQERVDLGGQLTHIGQQTIDTVDKMIRAGEARRIDLLQAKLEAENARIFARQASHQRQHAWRSLTAAMGLPEMPPAMVAGELEHPADPIRWEAALSRLQTESPLIAAAMAKVNQACWNVQRAQAEAVPDIDVELSVQHDNVSDDTLGGVQVEIPVPLFNRNQGRIAAAQAEWNAAQHNVERVRLLLSQQLAEEFRRYADARFQVDKYSQEMLPIAQQTLSLVDEGYQVGEVGYLELLTTQRTFVRITIQYLDALEQLWASRQRIEGLQLDASLNQ